MTPAVTRLRTHTDEIRPILDAQERTAEGIEKLRTTLVKIRRLVTRLEDKTSEWQEYIRGLQRMKDRQKNKFWPILLQ